MGDSPKFPRVGLTLIWKPHKPRFGLSQQHISQHLSEGDQHFVQTDLLHNWGLSWSTTMQSWGSPRGTVASRRHVTTLSWQNRRERKGPPHAVEGASYACCLLIQRLPATVLAQHVSLKAKTSCTAALPHTS